MKSKFTLITLCVLLFTNVEAQHIWAPAGAKWIHSFYEYAGSGYIESKIEGDTLLQGITCKKIWSRFGISNFGIPQEDTVYKVTGFTYSQNDSVFYGNSAASMQIIYIFGLQKGDTFTYHYPLDATACLIDSNVQLVIDSVGQTNQYGLNLSFYDSHFADTAIRKKFYTNFPRIIERVGTSYGHFYPTTPCFIDEYFASICYYEDDSTIHNPQQYASCKKLITSISCPTNTYIGFDIFPNPVVKSFTIQSGEFKPYSYSLLDVKGAVVSTSPVHTGNQTIDIADLQPGVYTLRIICDGNVFNKRIVLAQ